MSNASTTTLRACCNKSRAKGTYNLFFHGLRERLGPSTWHMAVSAVKVPTPKTMKQHNQGPPFQPGATQRPQLEAHSQPGLRHTLVCRVLSVAVLGATSSSEYTYCCAPRCAKYSSQSSGTPLIHISDK